MAVRRLAALKVLALLLSLARAAPAAPRALPVAPVDLDDDDDDGEADGAQEKLGARALADLADAGLSLAAATSGTLLRGPGGAKASGGVRLVQGLLPGRVLLDGGRVEGRFVAARWIDGGGKAVDPVRGGVELARTPPMRLGDDPLAPHDEVAFRLLLVGAADDLGGAVVVRSEHADGQPLDQLDAAEVRPVPCPEGVAEGLACRSTLPLRMALDPEDRRHPVSAARSLQAELGGRVVASLAGRKMLSVRVVGPQTTALGPIERLRARLRVLLVRERPRGGPPFGLTDNMAIGLARAQVARANSIWGQCGISFGAPGDVEVKLVDPPGPSLLAVGCELGLPASGGQIRLRVDGHEVTLAVTAGQTPAQVARRLSGALSALGIAPQLSDNLRIGPGALPTADLLLRRRDGTLAQIEQGSSPLSTDPTLRLCVGSVDFSDGLQHFTDVDAVAGSLEERTLLRALDDGDSRSVEAVLVPSFATGGRIGESFIAGDRSSLSNMLIEDRAGIRADTISFALAHELGHVLLDVPGHSDDYGVDTPLRLMDSDAADPSPFGPRRLTVGECERALRQSGPAALTPLLSPWPLRGHPKGGRKR